METEQILEGGDHKTLKTQVIVHNTQKKVYACGRKDKIIKQIVFTRGTTLPGEPKEELEPDV